MSKAKAKTVYSSTEIEPITIDDELHICFSKTILESAKIDHFVSLALFQLCSISFPVGFAIMGKMSISSKMKNLDFLVHASLDDNFCDAFDALSANISKFVELRNAIAHGIIMGKREDKYLINLYINPSETDGNFVNKIMTLTREEIYNGVENSVLITTEIKRLFRLDLLHVTNPSELHTEKPPTRRQTRKNRTRERP